MKALDNLLAAGVIGGCVALQFLVCYPGEDPSICRNRIESEAERDERNRAIQEHRDSERLRQIERAQRERRLLHDD